MGIQNDEDYRKVYGGAAPDAKPVAPRKPRVDAGRTGGRGIENDETYKAVYNTPAARAAVTSATAPATARPSWQPSPVNPAQSGYGMTLTPSPASPLAPPVAAGPRASAAPAIAPAAAPAPVAAPVAPAAPRVSGVIAKRQADGTMAPVEYVPPATATVPVVGAAPTFTQYGTPPARDATVMQSADALALQSDMYSAARGISHGGSTTQAMNRANSVEGMAAKARWEAARESALEGAMSPEAFRRYQADKDKRRMEQIANTEATPAYTMGEQAKAKDIGVAREAGAVKASEEAIKAAKDVATREESARGREDSRTLSRMSAIDANIFEYEKAGAAVPKRLTDEREILYKKMYGDATPAAEAAPADGNAARIAILTDRLAKFPNDPRAAEAAAELKRLQSAG